MAIQALLALMLGLGARSAKKRREEQEKLTAAEPWDAVFKGLEEHYFPNQGNGVMTTTETPTAPGAEWFGQPATKTKTEMTGGWNPEPFQNPVQAKSVFENLAPGMLADENFRSYVFNTALAKRQPGVVPEHITKGLGARHNAVLLPDGRVQIIQNLGSNLIPQGDEPKVRAGQGNTWSPGANDGRGGWEVYDAPGAPVPDLEKVGPGQILYNLAGLSSGTEPQEVVRGPEQKVAQTSVEVNTGEAGEKHPLYDRPITHAEQEADTEFVKNKGNSYVKNQYTADRNAINKLRDIKQAMLSGDFSDASGPLRAQVSRMTGGIAFPRVEQLESLINSAVGGSLRTLSGQMTGIMTDADARQAMSLVFDPAAPPEDNLRRIQDTINRLTYNSNVAKDMNEHFDRHGTTIGFQRSFISPLEDYQPQEISGTPKLPGAGVVEDAVSSAMERIMPPAAGESVIEDMPSDTTTQPIRLKESVTGSKSVPISVVTPENVGDLALMDDVDVTHHFDSLSEQEWQALQSSDPALFNALLSRIEDIERRARSGN